jgi:hypothetical protein
MAEWLKAHAWKACLLERVTWVRIPLSPPDSKAVTLPQITKPSGWPGAGSAGITLAKKTKDKTATRITAPRPEHLTIAPVCALTVSLGFVRCSLHLFPPSGCESAAHSKHTSPSAHKLDLDVHTTPRRKFRKLRAQLKFYRGNTYLEEYRASCGPPVLPKLTLDGKLRMKLCHDPVEGQVKNGTK